VRCNWLPVDLDYLACSACGATSGCCGSLRANSDFEEQSKIHAIQEADF
jgi:hypothetical protein